MGIIFLFKYCFFIFCRINISSQTVERLSPILADGHNKDNNKETHNWLKKKRNFILLNYFILNLVAFDLVFLNNRYPEMFPTPNFPKQIF